MDAKRRKMDDYPHNESGSGEGTSGADNSDAINVPIRLLRVGPVKVDTNDHIKVYFERFGIVNSIEIQQDDNSDTLFAMVEFKTADDAAKVLSSNEMHRIDGCDVQVRAAEPWQQPDHILNALNNDCIRAILFELSFPDLLNAANVCTAFNQQAKSVFSTKIKKLFLTSGSRDEAKKILQTFGSVAHSVDMNAEYLTTVKIGYEMEILSMVAQHCTSSLKELTLRYFSFEDEQPNDINFVPAFSKLERLAFINCHFRNQMNGLLAVCTELKVLNFRGCHQHHDLSVWPKFDKLEELQLIDVPNVHQFVTGFSSSNSSLTKLSLIENSGFLSNNPSRTVDTIVEHYSNLVELDFEMTIVVGAEFKQCVRHLERLTSLKVLKFNLNGRHAKQLGTILTANALPIEHLELNKGTIDTETIEAISQMNQLKILRLCDISGLTDEHAIELAKGLGSRLEKLQLDGSTANNITTFALKTMLPFATKLSFLSLNSTKITIDANDYQEMLKIVQERPEKVQFFIELFGRQDQVKVIETVLMEKRDIFYIEVKESCYRRVI